MVTNEPAVMDLVFRALAHASRRRILDILRARSGLSVGELAAEFDVTRIAVMKHLAVLAEAGLVTSRAEGRERHVFFNPVPIQLVHRRWVSDFAGAAADHAIDIRDRVEGRRPAARKSAKEATHA